ncbi:ABC transporter substrate-binding protein [Piscinibacter sakaiensis]|uniref:Spermidine/putrescine-binding periplasmic protein n=1 Tax=Piscinibacter sakaiensis TaxID=1547922 RepID=A0A0K8P899_PISS1|nr:ABC transporter substrate-binding protein [Piscinibacter sakaiensis]GAP38862.1 spermidine/putrescine-binding periplasmic protein [Piscinibacter sakaiensis]
MTPRLPRLAALLAAAALCAAGAAQAQPKQIVTANTGGPYLEATLEAWGKTFSQKTGIKVVGDGPQSLPKIQQMVQSGNVTWDVVEVPPVFTLRHCGTLFAELPADLQNRKDVLAGFGNACGVPDAGYANLMLYNTKKYPNGGPKNWADFFDVQKFPGKRALWNGAEGVNLEIALMADGVAPKDLYPMDLDRAFAKLTKLRPHLVFWSTGAQSTQMMESQEVDMLMAWSSRAYPALKNKAPYEPVWNQHIVYNNVLAILKGAPNPGVSADYIRNALEPANQARLTELFPVTPAVIGVKPQLDEAGQKVFAATPERVANAVRPNLKWVADNAAEIQRRWVEWLNR